MINSIKYIFSRIGMVRKVGRLHFTLSGIDDEGIPFVEYDGLRFHGKPSNPRDKKYYQILPPRVRIKLSFECFRTAQEIVIRYIEGGLKYGGPKKQAYYKIKEGDTVAEMGAYHGFFALKLCKMVGTHGRVITIEPLPDNLKLLRKNISFNGFDDLCTIVPKGVWNEKTTLSFKRKADDHQSGSIVLGRGNEDIMLPVDSLDNIMVETNTVSCDMMIIQLNGVEIDALSGLKSFRPENLAIAARYDQPGMDVVSEIIKLLKERKYKVYLEEDRFVFAHT